MNSNPLRPYAKEISLSHAITIGNLGLVKDLLSKGVYIGDEKILQLAARNGHLEIVKYLISKGAVMGCGWDGATVGAATNGHLDIVKYLISVGKETAWRNWPQKLQDQLYFSTCGAAKNGHLETVKYLVDEGADVALRCEASTKTVFNEFEYRVYVPTPMCGAVCNGHLEVVQFLCFINSSEVANAVSKGWFDEHLTDASHYGHLKVVEYLVSMGVTGSKLAVKRAMRCRHLDIVRYLVSIGVDYNRCGLEELFGVESSMTREQVITAIDMFLVNRE